MKKYILTIFATLFLASLLLSCGTRDDRDDIRAQYGEPDAIRRRSSDPFWSETWYYNSIGLAFEFRRTSGCGSQRDVYLYLTYTFTPVSPDSTGANFRNPSESSGAPEHSTQPIWPVAPR